MAPVVDATNTVHGPMTDASFFVDAEKAAIRNSCGSPSHISLPLSSFGKVAFTVENVLSPTECDYLVAAAETIGFAAAGLGSAGKQEVATRFRDSGRIISEDPRLAGLIFERLRRFFPRVWHGRRIIGLNEQLKFLRYYPGQYFAPHFDGRFCRHGTSNCTFLTVQVYIARGNVKGGCTRFVDGAGGVRCTPDFGKALVFQHNILHEGEEVLEGVKYTLRSDVEYGPESWHAKLQEFIGLGGPPCERSRRFWSLLAVGVGIVAMLAARSSLKIV
eukprot:TRINITY_DN15795_c0_g1_i1.p1 TRINITY_DN15795_c0_g1~~TRINITY_DN15795_c0_g1_i1.p1  ORF type:complete len:292 (-),score=51.22 TRINITY_DN15795_c0_g1_i1:45-866(-)